jgi:AcrR family transcriptional regulator
MSDGPASATGDATRSLVGEEPDGISATDGRMPGSRGLATRRRLLDCTAGLLETTSWRSIRVIDIAREAGTSPATFYQYFENVENAILVLAEELMEGAERVGELVDGDWSEQSSWPTARRVVDGFADYWESNRAVFRVVDLTTEEGDRRFQGPRVRALNAVTLALARAIDTNRDANDLCTNGVDPGTDAMALAASVVSMLAHVAAHRYGFEFWGIRTSSMTDSESRILHWAVTGRAAP